LVNVAVLGYGVVGGGVAQMLTREPTHMTSRLNRQPKLGAILDIREFPDSPYGDLFVKDFAKIEERDDIRIVAETIGGVGIAKEFTERAIKAGKHVVTSNKELVATHGDSLMKLAREHKVNYLFEASVGGGIPVIRPLRL
jgi:homoserine dehydrogenase